VYGWLGVWGFLVYFVWTAYDTQEAEWLQLRLHGSMSRRELRLAYESFTLRRYEISSAELLRY